MLGVAWYQGGPGCAPCFFSSQIHTDGILDMLCLDDGNSIVDICA